MKNVIVAHPGKQHSYRLASALKKAGMLDCYVTTIYNKNTFFDKFLSKFLSKDNKKRAEKRRNPDLVDSEVVQFCSFRGLVETFLYRTDKSKRIYEKYRQKTANKFGEKVAKLAIKRNVDAVVMYDTNAAKCFEILSKKAPSIKRILDVSIATGPCLRDIYDREIKNSMKNDLRMNNAHFWEDKTTENLNNEIKYSDYFLAASNFVLKSIEYCGADRSKIEIVPYGANVSIAEEKKFNNAAKKLLILFVGQVNYRKGVPYLLKAVSELKEEVIDLTLVGAYNPKDWFVKEYMEKPNIHFIGLVTFDKMKEYYSDSDVFVIDSFAEGMAQVGIEAMACGLPIICSTNSGVNDIVTEGENGFIIPPGDADVLKEKLQWFIDNRDKIPEMSENALEVGRKYTWEYYEDNIEKAFKEILGDEA